MNKRILKKTAKRFLETGMIAGRHIAGIDEFRDGDSWKTQLVLRSSRLHSAVYAEARRGGWDGCHWSNPLLLSVDEI